MGGKSSTPAPPSYTPPDMSGLNNQINQMQLTIDELSKNLEQAPIPELPEINIPKPTIPEAPKPEEFLPKDERQKKGLLESILTSPLLDEEKAKTTKSTLG